MTNTEFNRVGLALDFAGGLFLALQIIGRERLARAEARLDAVRRIPSRAFELLVRRIAGPRIRRVMERNDIRRDLEESWRDAEPQLLSQRYARKRAAFASTVPSEPRGDAARPSTGRSGVPVDVARYPGIAKLAFVVFKWMAVLSPVRLAVWLVMAPISLPLTVALFLRDRLRFESAFAVIGVILLLGGFVLQLLGTYPR